MRAEILKCSCCKQHKMETLLKYLGKCTKTSFELNEYQGISRFSQLYQFHKLCQMVRKDELTASDVDSALITSYKYSKHVRNSYRATADTTRPVCTGLLGAVEGALPAGLWDSLPH